MAIKTVITHTKTPSDTKKDWQLKEHVTREHNFQAGINGRVHLEEMMLTLKPERQGGIIYDKTECSKKNICQSKT